MNIVLIGTGNVAFHFTKAIVNAGHNIVCIAGRNIMHASELCHKAEAFALHARPHSLPMTIRATSDFASVPLDADIYLIAVTDDAIENVAQQLPDNIGVVTHTSGATHINALARYHRRGVIYPCQTFTASDEVDFSNLPLMLESSNAESEHVLMSFAKSISNCVDTASSLQRLHIHIAAVFASNFSNHMIALAKKHSDKNGIDYHIFKELTLQTINKAFRMDPVQAQTGPARRNDRQTIERHISLIDDNHAKQIYKLVTDSIISTEKQRKK